MKKIISALLSASVGLSICPVNVLARGFSDVEKESFAYEEINYLADKGVIRGIGDGMFAPESPVTRADFSVMADRAMELSGDETTEFTDVNVSDYYYYAVKRAAASGIISGTGNLIFEPNRNITREEAATILVRAYENLCGAADQAITEFADDDEISAWAKENVKKAVLLGFLTSDSDKIEPKRYMSRAETAYALSNYLMLLSVMENRDDRKKSVLEQTTARGNIFLESMKERKITLKTEKKMIDYYVRDYWGNEKESGRAEIINKEYVFDFSEYKPGYYELYIEASDRDGIKEEIAKTSFCVFEDFNFKDLEYSPFGMNTHITRTQSGWRGDLLYEASLAGIRHIRDSDEWHGVERSKGVYTDTWAEHRQTMKKYNMDICWVSAFVNPFYDHNSTPYTDEGRLGYANFCNAVCDIWGEDMKFMEVYNEWWGPQFGDRGNGKADSLPETFVPLIKKTYEVVKPNHPDVILMPTFNENRSTLQPNWNTRVFNLNILDYMDVAALHGYAGTYKDIGEVEPEDALGIKFGLLLDELKEKYPDRKVPVYITETGVTSSTNKYGISEVLGARYVPRLFTTCMDLGAEYIWWYDLIDDGNTDSEHEDRFGVLRAFGSEWGNYAPKPTYVAYGAFARTIAGQRFSENKTQGDIYWYTYTGDGETTNVIHTRDAVRKNITVYTSSPVEVIDLMGGKEIYTPVDGKLYFTANLEAFYLKGDIEKIEEGAPVEIAVNEEIILEENFRVDVENNTDLDVLIDGNKVEGNYYISREYKKSGEASVIAKLSDDGNICGRLAVIINPEARYNIVGNGDMKIEGNGIDGFINATVENYSPNTLPISGVVWTLGEKSGIFATNELIEGNSSKTLTIPVGEVKNGEKYSYTLRLQIDGITSDKRDLNDVIAFNTVERYTPVIDGVIDEGLSGYTAMNLDEGEVSSLIDGRKYEGTNDLGGRAWMTYDDENIYWSVLVTDDEHNAKDVNDAIWRNDSLQFTVYCENSSLYDTQTKYFEFGLSLLEDGPQMWRWSAIDGLPADKKEVPGAEFAVVRNEAEKTTVYEVAIPWKTISINPKTEKNIRSSILINDNDKGQRKTFLEWGSGIGYGKAPEKFIKYIIMESDTK